jgi:ComF family protein
MHRKNRIVRGYNQTEVISKVIAKSLDIPIDTKAINIEYSKVTQHSLSKRERFKHANSIYSKGVSNVQDKYIILVDDIMTTGSTVNVCSNILQSMGAKSIIVAVATSAQLDRSKVVSQKDR